MDRKQGWSIKPLSSGHSFSDKASPPGGSKTLQNSTTSLRPSMQTLWATFHIQIADAILWLVPSWRYFFFLCCFCFQCNHSTWPLLSAFTFSFLLSSSKHSLSLIFSAPTNKQHSNRFSLAPLLVYLEGFAISPWKVP